MSQWCDSCSSQHTFIVQYEPRPNSGQIESDSIPTKSLPIGAGVFCRDCGSLISLHEGGVNRSFEELRTIDELFGQIDSTIYTLRGESDEIENRTDAMDDVIEQLRHQADELEAARDEYDGEHYE